MARVQLSPEQLAAGLTEAGVKISESYQRDVRERGASGFGNLINLRPEFSSPDGWQQQVQGAAQTIADARLGGSPQTAIDERGLPVNWNYRTANAGDRLGPWGAALPSQALGWLPTGQPDFGGGFQGALKRAWYNLYEKPRGDIQATSLGAHGPTATALRQQLSDMKLTFETSQEAAASFVRAAPVALGAGIQYMKDLWTTAEDNETIFGKTTQFIGAGFGLLGDSLNELAMAVERDIIGPRALAAEDLIRQKSPAEAEWLDNFRPLGALSVLAPIAVASKLQLQGLITRAESEAAIDRNRDAARMAYTAWFDPAAREEYMRRLKAGEDPRLLALELENPGAELAGRVIFDPLNLLDVFQVGAKLHGLARLRTARRELTMIRYQPLATALDGFRVASGEAETVQAGRRLLDAYGSMVDAARQGNLELAGRRGLTTLTAAGKRTVVGQQANNFMSTVLAATSGDPDLANSVWKGLAFAADADPARRGEGLAILNQVIADSKGGLPANVLMSESGTQTAILLNRLLLDDAGHFNVNAVAHLLEEAGDDPAKLASLLEQRLNKALEGQFPTIQQQIAAHDEYTKLSETNAAAADELLRRIPLAAQEPGPFSRALVAVDEVAQKYFYRPAGELQARLFMGAFPGSLLYRANNRWGNFLPTFVDVGPQAAIRGFFGVSPGRSLEKTADMLGGTIPEGAVRGIGPGLSFRDAKGAGNGIDRFFTGGLRGAAKDEAANAAFVVEKSVRRTMTSALRAERRIIGRDLRDLPEAQRRILTDAMRKTWGRVDEAIDALRSEDGYDISRNLAFLSEEQIDRLHELRLYDPALAAAREGESLDDVLLRLDEVRDQYRAVGRGAGKEAVIHAMDEAWGQNMAQEARAIEQWESAQAADTFQRRLHEAREADRLFDDAVFGDAGLKRLAEEQIIRRSLAEARAAGRTDDDAVQLAMAQLDGIGGPLEREIREATARTFEDADAFRDETWRLTEQSRGRQTDDAWLRRRWAERDLGPLPERLSAERFRNALWSEDHYRRIQNERWGALREQNANRYRMAAGRYASAAGLPDINTPLVNSAEAQLARSRLMDRAVIMPDGRAVIQFAPGQEGVADIVRTLARHLGVQVNPEAHAGLIERIDPVTGQTGLGLASIEPLETGGAQITLTDELLNQAPEVLAESLAHEFSHLFEDTPEGADILRRLYGGDFEQFVRDILYETGLQRRTPPTPQRSEALQSMFQRQGDIASPIVMLRDLEAGPQGFRISLIGSADDAVPSPNRFFHESRLAATEAIDQLKNAIRQNWGRAERGALDPRTERRLAEYAIGARQRITEAQAIAINVANQTRDFILHNYGKRYGMDLVAGYIWPYQFWHSRTYLKWMLRLVEHPGLAAAYFKYRKALEDQHAGLPEWWKYNINVTDLLGIETEHPLWFNLERTLNPLNGLTGVDFNDPRRRLDMWSASVEDLNKFGPTVWMPFQVLLALKYHMQGEDEAAARWAGRLWSPSRLVRDVTALLDPKGLGVELDPFINFFGGGLDPWERARVGRQLAALQSEGVYPAAEIIDAARNQAGPIWDEARARAINIRAPNLPVILAPFFLGTGFKPRTQEDVEIDAFYAQMYGLIRNKPNMSSEEYRAAWGELERQYPFMDALLLSKRSGLDRDEALAWNVLDRIPPGMADDIAERVGMDPELLGRFHETKGDLETMNESERLQFIGGILAMAALLDVPDGATQAEWQAARSLYRQMQDRGRQQFGAEIWDEVDTYFALFDPENPEAGDAYLGSHPQVSRALDWQQLMVMSTPLLAAYYTSEERIRKYYKRQMYSAAEGLFGEDIFDHFDVYYMLRDAGESTAARRYWRDHPQMAAYVKFRDAQLPLIDARVLAIARALPDAAPPQFREEQEELAAPGAPRSEWIERQFARYATGQRETARAVAQQTRAVAEVLSPALYRLYLDLLEGEEIPDWVEEEIRRRLEAAGL